MRKLNTKIAKSFVGLKRQMLTAVKFVRYTHKDQLWLFKCDCGKTKLKRKSYFIKSNTNHCGCNPASRKHGWSVRLKNGLQKPIYSTWVNIRQRCNNPNKPDYKYYGGRGIKVCKRWEKFNNFYADIGDRPKNMTLDRIDVNGDYCPSNCKWATREEQSNNRNYNRIIEYLGKKQSLGKWRKEIPIKISTRQLHKRIFYQHWSIDKAFTMPIKKF